MTDTLASAERLISILLLFSEEKPAWSSDQLMRATGYSRTSLYRYLKTLKDTGLIVLLPQHGYMLGPRLTELDYLMQRSDPIILHGRRYLRGLAENIPCSAFLTRWYEQKILCVASEVSAPRPRSSYPRGRPMPLGRGAISRAILAHLPKPQRAAMIAQYLPDFQQLKLGLDIEEVEAVFRQIRRQGYAIAYGEVTPGVVGIAAPILVAPMTPVAALCISLEGKETAASQLQDFAKSVRRSADDISQILQNQFASEGQRAGARASQLEKV